MSSKSKESDLIDTNNRLAAAEFDIQKIAEHMKIGTHPDMNGT